MGSKITNVFTPGTYSSRKIQWGPEPDGFDINHPFELEARNINQFQKWGTRYDVI